MLAVEAVAGASGGDSPGLSNLTAHGGFLPEGGVTVLSGIVVVIFAFVGAEIVTIAAAESDELEQAVARATNAVVWRVLVFSSGAGARVLRGGPRAVSCPARPSIRAPRVERGRRVARSLRLARALR